MNEDRLFHLLIELHDGLERLGPGTTASTLRALSLCRGLPAHPAVLDVGCGTGAAALDLAVATGGTVTAVDTVPCFLDTLRERASRRGLSDRVRAVEADMQRLPFPHASFDLVWSEGAVYNMGFDAGLAAWGPLLRPGGWLALTELSWCVPNPPEDAVAHWAVEYPGLRSVDANLRAARSAGYRVEGHFTLPAEAWTDAYHGPLRRRLDAFLARHAGDEVARELVDATRREMMLFPRHGDVFGYEFYVLQGGERTPS